MDREILDFWKDRNLPVGLMVQKVGKWGVTRAQVERAAELVFEEAWEIVENVPEIYPYTTDDEYRHIILFRNMLKPNHLGWRVNVVSKSISAKDYEDELTRSKKYVVELEESIEKGTLRYRLGKWWQGINWELDEWQ